MVIRLRYPNDIHTGNAINMLLLSLYLAEDEIAVIAQALVQGREGLDGEDHKVVIKGLKERLERARE